MSAEIKSGDASSASDPARDRYMMATHALHLTGDISRDEPSLAIIYGEDENAYIGEWATGIGFVNVRFPKVSTRNLTEDERRHYDGKLLVVADRVRPIRIDSTPPAPWRFDVPEPPDGVTALKDCDGDVWLRLARNKWSAVSWPGDSRSFADLIDFAPLVECPDPRAAGEADVYLCSTCMAVITFTTGEAPRCPNCPPPAAEPAPVPPPVDALLKLVDEFGREAHAYGLGDDSFGDTMTDSWKEINSRVRALWAAGVEEGRQQLEHAEKLAALHGYALATEEITGERCDLPGEHEPHDYDVDAPAGEWRHCDGAAVTEATRG